MELERSAVKRSKLHSDNTNITNKQSSTSKFLYTHIDEKCWREKGEGSKREQWSTRNRKAGGLFGQGWWKKGEDGRAVGSN